jgi:hypothetical protein
MGYTGEEFDMEIRKKHTSDPTKLDKIRKWEKID